MKISWLWLSEADLNLVFDYIRKDNPDAALSVLEMIRGAVERLASFPEMGRPGRVAGTRELILPRLPYVIAYRVRGGGIEILRVLHAARRWPEDFSGLGGANSNA